MKRKITFAVIIGLVVLALLALALDDKCLVLRFADTRNMDMSACACKYISITGKRMEGVNLEGSHFSMGELGKDYLSRARLARAYWFGDNVKKTDLKFADMRNMYMDMVAFSNSDMRHANLSGSTLQMCSFVACDLRDADLTGVKLRGCTYDIRTLWPIKYDPASHGALCLPPQSGPGNVTGLDGLR